MNIHPIAYFRSPFPTKFGIPKQSGLVESLEGIIVFEPAYRSADALVGIDGFDFLWLIWQFSANPHPAESLMVRPPVLGGNEKVGVFASRSPFRPNSIGLSSVRLQRIEWDTPEGPVIHVLGADLMDGTPIFDIKPYIPFADCHPEARSGYTGLKKIRHLEVLIPDDLLAKLAPEKMETLRKVLSLDPRPAVQDSADKVYGMPFEAWDIRFKVDDQLLTVVEIE